MTLKFDPDWVVAPGETLADWFQEMHLPLSIGRHYGFSEEQLQRLIAGKLRITPARADQLEAMTTISSLMWLALEHNFRVGLAAGKHWSGGDK